jgi:hypothetical protein
VQGVLGQNPHGGYDIALVGAELPTRRTFFDTPVLEELSNHFNAKPISEFKFACELPETPPRRAMFSQHPQTIIQTFQVL